MPEIINIFKKNCENLMKSHGWNQARLADESGVTSSSISLMFLSEESNPRLDTIEKISSALGVTVSEILSTQSEVDSFKNLPTDIRKMLLGVKTEKHFEVLRVILKNVISSNKEKKETA